MTYFSVANFKANQQFNFYHNLADTVNMGVFRVSGSVTLGHLFTFPIHSFIHDSAQIQVLTTETNEAIQKSLADYLCAHLHVFSL